MDYKDYKLEDKLAREDYINSRNDVIRKSDATELWTKVISKAIDDIIYYTVLENKQNLKEEEEACRKNAREFLFNDEHRVPFDYYTIITQCPECNNTTELQMSDYISGIEMCNNCSAFYDTEETLYDIAKLNKEISFRELLSIIWDIDNVEEFREGIERRIKMSVEKRICQKK